MLQQEVASLLPLACGWHRVPCSPGLRALWHCSSFLLGQLMHVWVTSACRQRMYTALAHSSTAAPVGSAIVSGTCRTTVHRSAPMINDGSPSSRWIIPISFSM